MIPAGRGSREEAESRRFLYPGTEVLINKLGLRDAHELELVERAIVERRIGQALPSAAQQLTYPGFKAIHRHLFQDVYAWAGKERTYTTGRGPAPFATPENIGSWMERQFGRLQAQGQLRGLDPDRFALAAAELVNEINAAHPFIEGNGRTQRTWLRLVGLQAGHEIALRSADREAWYAASRIGFERADHEPMATLIRSRMTAVELPFVAKLRSASSPDKPAAASPSPGDTPATAPSHRRSPSPG